MIRFRQALAALMLAVTCAPSYGKHHRPRSGMSPLMVCSDQEPTYMPFCQPGSTKLSMRSKQRLDEVGSAWKRVPSTIRFVSGNTDVDEAQTARPRLGLERAKVVEAYLMSQGVPADHIALEDYGASRPFVASIPSEPQNRRVDVQRRWTVPN